MSKNTKTPDTIVGDEGSAKRNILRKNNKGKSETNEDDHVHGDAWLMLCSNVDTSY